MTKQRLSNGGSLLISKIDDAVWAQSFHFHSRFDGLHYAGGILQMTDSVVHIFDLKEANLCSHCSVSGVNIWVTLSGVARFDLC